MQLSEIQYPLMSLDRHATENVARLIYASAPDMFGLMFGRRAIAILSELVSRSHNRFSYKHIYVAEWGDRILGSATIVTTAQLKENSDYKTVLSLCSRVRLNLVKILILNHFLRYDYPSNSAYITNLAVDPEYRSQGIGTQLLRRCIAGAEAAGKRAVFISVSATNPRAQKLYESLGFRVIEVRELQLLGATLGAHILELPLH